MSCSLTGTPSHSSLCATSSSKDVTSAASPSVHSQRTSGAPRRAMSTRLASTMPTFTPACLAV